jgi:hypothetical protein
MSKFVVAIKNNDKFLRDKDGIVYLPFGSEYSIYMKNLNSRKALVSISVDGKDILNGEKLIVNANKSIDLDCFIDKLSNNNKLKFIQFSKKIQDHIGDNAENGFIRVEFQLEKEKPEVKINQIDIYHHRENYYNPFYHPIWEPMIPTYEPTWRSNEFYCSSSTNNDVAKTVTTNSLRCAGTMSCSTVTPDSFNDPLPEEGLTVQGSISNQSFIYGSIGELEDNKAVFVLQLKGFKPDGKNVVEPITVQHVIDCPTCGKKNGSFSRYCNNCGTRLS